MSSGTFAENFLAEAAEIIAKLDVASIEKAAQLLAKTRSAGGRSVHSRRRRKRRQRFPRRQ